MAPDSHADPVTLTEVINGYVADGYTLAFYVVDDGLHCPDGRVVGVRDVTIHSLRRLEGASDPADEVSVAAVDVDGYGKGTIVLRHGPAASLAEVQLLAAARDARGSSDIPPDMPSNERG
jgi:hypothetical protein